MKSKKGNAGYLRARKIRLAAEAVVSFALVAAIVITGYVTTKTRLNLLTLVAVLGCLPACRILVNLIMVIPHRSIHEAKELEISAHTEDVTCAYDLVITSERSAIPVEAVVIYNNTIFGYAPSPKVDTAYAARHIKSILKQNGFEQVSVKLFPEYKAFLSRAEGLNNIAAVEQADTKAHEEALKQILLDISL